MRDLIIGGCSGYSYDQIKYWINSVNRCGFDGDKVLIVFDCDDELERKVKDQGFKVVKYPLDNSSAIHVQRFLAIAEYIFKNPARCVITTDVKDVIFQRDPVEWLEQHSFPMLVTGSECLRYKDEYWGNNNLFETFGGYIYNKYRDNIIYNVGVLGGQSNAVRDICLNIAVNSVNRPIQICDQAVFNFLISNDLYKNDTFYANMGDYWAAHLGTVADPRKMHLFRPHLLEGEPEFIDGKVTYKGVPVYIAHQYDRTNWREELEKMYG